MKKVVLLAGALAAGMAVAPVTANAAAPKGPEVNLAPEDAPYQDYEHYYNVLAARHTDLELMKQDVKDAIANPSTAKDDYKGMSKESLALILADIQDQINELDGLQTAVKTLYDAMSTYDKNDKNYSDPAWNAAVSDAVTYVTTKVTADQFNKLLDTYKEFDRQHQIWEGYDDWYNDPTTGFAKTYADYLLTQGYLEVDGMTDVQGNKSDLDGKISTFTSTLVEPVLDGDNHTIKNPIGTALESSLATAKGEVVTANTALTTLVSGFFTDRNTLRGNLTTTWNTYDDTKYDPTAEKFKVADWADSDKYTSAINAKKLEVENAKNKLQNQIDSYYAADNNADYTAWNVTPWNGEGTQGTSPVKTKDLYNSTVATDIEALETLIGEYDDLVSDAEANVAACKALKGKIADMKSEVADLRTNYWDFRKEGAAGANNVTPANDRYVYRALILAAEGEINTLETTLQGKYESALPVDDDAKKLRDDLKTADNEDYKTEVAKYEGYTTAWKANEDARQKVTDYLGTHSTNYGWSLFGGYGVVTWGTGDDAGKLYKDRANSIATVDAFETVQVWDKTANAYVAKDVVAADYNADFTCEHGENVNGYSILQTVLNNARNNHFAQYNNITLDNWVKTTLEDADGNLVGTAKTVEEMLALIDNQAATDQAQLLMERVKGELDRAKDKMEALDDQCHEARACDDADCGDTQANPCGWHHKDTAALLDAIENAATGTIKGQDDVITTKHNDEKAVEDDIIALTTTFMNSVLGAGYDNNFDNLAGTLGAWVTDFKAKDAAHKEKLDNTKAEIDNAIHDAIHVVAAQAKFDLANFEKGDIAAADLWAKALTGLDLNLDGTPDTYADFAAFVDALDKADEIYKAKAKELYDLHYWTQLDALLQTIVKENTGLQAVNTYKQAVETNRTATIVLREQLATAQATLDAARDAVDQFKVYSPLTNMGGTVNDFAALTSTANATDPLAVAQAALNAELANITAANEAGTAKDYTFKKATVDAAIDTYVAAVHAAEFKYTANHEAYQALEAALTEFDGVVKIAEKAAQEAKLGGAIYSVVIEGDNNDATDVDAKMALLRVDTAADAVTIDSEHDHYLDGFKAATLAGDKATELSHLATLQTKLNAAEEALLAATAFKVKNVEAYDHLYSQLAAVTETRTALDTEWEAAKDHVYEVTDHKDQTEVQNKINALAKIDGTDGLANKLNKELAAGTILAHAETLSGEIATLTNGIQGVRALIAEKVKFFEAEKAAAAEYKKQVDDLKVLLGSVDTWACYEDVDINDHDFKALDALYQEINKAIEDEETAISTDLKAGNVQAHAEDYLDGTETVDGHKTVIEKIDSRIYDLQHAVSEAEKFYADEHALAADYDKQVADLEKLQETLDTVWAVYEDIENGKDAAALNAAYQAVTEAIAAERKAIADDLKAGHVQAHAEDYVVAGETVKGHETVIGDINDAIKALQDNVRLFEKFYADEHAAADKYNDELNNLETLQDALGTVWNAYEDIESNHDLAALHAEWQAVTEAIATERAAIADDLKAGNVQAHAEDYVVAGETVKGHETVLGDIRDAITTLQDKVRDIEEYKATNDKNYAALVEQTNDLLASLEDVRYVNDDVYETFAGLDLEGMGMAADEIEAARAEAVKAAKDELTALAAALEAGKLYSEAEVNGQKNAIKAVADALEALKEQVKAAEDFHRANAEAKDKLEEHAQALLALINTAYANSVCDLCNTEDTADVDAEREAVNDILGDVAESFVYGHLALPTAADNYAKYEQDLEGVDAQVKATLDEIAEHKVRQINDQNAYNVLQKALVDVDLWLANVQLEDGWENFAVRGAHTPDGTMCTGVESNPDVKYLNELTDAINDLKNTIEAQHAHEGVAVAEGYVGLGHVCEENKIEDMKQMKALIEDAKTLIAAIQANEAAHELLQERFGELYADALDAYNFWHQYYSEQTLSENDNLVNNKWVEVWNGELEGGWTLDLLQNALHNSYVHGNAANAWTVDAQGKELNDAATGKFAGYDADLANDRNYLAHEEAKNHANQVGLAITDYVALTEDAYTFDGMDDPFVADVLKTWREDVTGENGLVASLNYYKEQIELAYAEGVMEDAINIDEHNAALGIHQQLNGVLAVLGQIKAEYEGLFEDAHHLTNGKTLYSDMQYVTIGFFRKANEGLGEQATEMFKVVEPHFDAEEGNIGIYDTNWLNVTEWNDVNNTPDNWFDDVPAAYERDENGYLVHQEGLGVIPAEIGVLGHGDKKNELTFTLNDEKGYEVVTLAAGKADITFKPGSLSVYDQYNNEWLTKHNVYIEVNVEAPKDETVDAPVATGSNKLIVRLDNPIDLTYTNNSLVARTNDGTEFSYADRVINYAAGQLEFILPEGTQTVELPEGFFTFRTGENTIARSAAMTVAVGTATSIEGLIAMGEKAQIFDLQGRRVKAEALISGNTYVVNGEKVMVK